MPLPRACPYCSRTLALEIGCSMYIKRVPTKENISDDPSRERYGLLGKMGVGCTAQPAERIHCLPPKAHYVDARLEERFHNAQSWDSLITTAHEAWKKHVAEAAGSAAIVIED